MLKLPVLHISSTRKMATMASLPRLLYRSFCTSAAAASETTTNPSLPSLKTLVNELFDERNLKKLVEKFKKSSEHNRFRSKHRVYETTVRRLASAKRFSYIEEILEDQKKYPDMSKEGFSIRIISLYGKSGMFDHASKTFDQLPELKCDRTVKSFNALLSACIDSKNFDKVETLFRDYQSKFSITPDVYSYNIVIRAFCEMGSLDNAVSMLDEMEINGLSPDLVTFSRLIDVLYVDGRFSDAEMIWDRMEKNNLVPDVRTINVKVRGLILMGKMSDAVKLVEELDSKGLKPDVHSFNALIDGFCKDGNVEEAKRFYNELLKNESIPNRLTLETLVPSLCEKGEFGMAVEMCMEGLNRRCYVDAWLLQVLVDGLVKESKVEEAKKLVALARLKQYGRSSLKMPDHVESK